MGVVLCFQISMGVRKRKEAGGQAKKEETTTGEGSSVHITEPPDWPTNMTQTHLADVGCSMGRRMLHWGPIIALTLIFYIGGVTSWLNLQWWPINSIGGFIHFTIFLYWNYSTLVNFSAAAYFGPGYLPRNWTTHSGEGVVALQQCSPCDGFKAPRSHHCSKCARCVLKMDHHCPWINNCVGHRNHAYFIIFLVSACVGCTHAAIVIGFSVYHAVNLGWYSRFAAAGSFPVVELTLWSFIASIMGIALAAGVAIALGVLLYVQLRIVLANKTSLEEYIMQKAAHSRDDDESLAPFDYPYDLGWWRNTTEVLSSWGKTKGNGIWYPTRHPADQFSFTKEQLRQKAQKRERARMVVATADYEGSWWRAVRLGIRPFFCQPLSPDEARVPVKRGDRWMVTRGQRYWLYGRKVVDGEASELKGWLPRSVVELLPAEE